MRFLQRGVAAPCTGRPWTAAQAIFCNETAKATGIPPFYGRGCSFLFVYMLFSGFCALRQNAARAGGIVIAVRTYTVSLRRDTYGCTEWGKTARKYGASAAGGAHGGAAVAGGCAGGRCAAGRGAGLRRGGTVRAGAGYRLPARLLSGGGGRHAGGGGGAPARAAGH